jgi:hypothetical protein
MMGDERCHHSDGEKTMNDMLNKLPSVGQMFKLVVVLILAVIAVGLVMALVKMLLPLAILAALVAGGIMLYKRAQRPSAV